MTYLEINNFDVSNMVKSLKISYETIISESATNANGDTVIDIVNRKRKLAVKFRPLFDEEMRDLLYAMDEFVVPVAYRDSKSMGTEYMICHISTPEPEYYCILDDKVIYKEMSLNLIEM